MCWRDKHLLIRPFVKTVRIWFLLLLAVLLPARGAVAAAMLCPVGTGGVQQEMVLSGEAARHDAMEHMHAHPAGLGQAAEHGHAATSHDDGHTNHDHTTSDRCNACSAFCSLTPLVSSVPSVFEPLDPAGVKFSRLSAPAPSFLSDGQERPPRTI
jgi:hypothetical protein